MNTRFAPQVWGQGPGPVALAITASRQTAARVARWRDLAQMVPPKPAEGGFPYPHRNQRQVRLHEQGFDW